MRRWGAVYGTALIVGFLACALPAPAENNETSLPPATAARIDELAKNEVHAGRTPGVAIGVVQGGRLVYARGFGFANVAKHVRMTPDTRFFTGALTREFTAAAILLLAQDGKLSLDDKLGKFLPNFKVGSDVTISQLLLQTSGLPSYTTVPGFSADLTHPMKVSDLLVTVDRLKPAAPPGTAYANNPLNYLLAGVVVERASGVPLSDYLEQHVFLPLVMDHTLLAGDNGILPSHATGYTRSGRGFGIAAAWDPAWLGGDSALVSTIYDLAKWDIEMPVLLRVDSVRTMFTPSPNDGPTPYGMGWVIDRRGGQDFVWSNGEISGYRATNGSLPAQHVSVIVLSNADSLHGASTIPEELSGRILDVMTPPAAAQLDNAVVARAKEWLAMLASGHINRSELTPSFSAYLSDDLVVRENFGALGPVQAIVPVSSNTEANGDTVYEFLVTYPSAQYHYKFQVTSDGKIDGLALTA